LDILKDAHVDINNGKKLEIPVYGFIRKASVASYMNILLLVRKPLEAWAPRLTDAVIMLVSCLICQGTTAGFVKKKYHEFLYVYNGLCSYLRDSESLLMFGVAISEDSHFIQLHSSAIR
jgi:hypothetical protein